MNVIFAQICDRSLLTIG